MWIDAKKTASWNDLADKPVIKSLTWTNIDGKPSNLTDFGVKTEVQQMIDSALQNFSPSGGSGATSGTPPVSFFTSPMACVDDGVVYATIFSRKTRLNLGGNVCARVEGTYRKHRSGGITKTVPQCVPSSLTREWCWFVLSVWFC